MERGDTITDRYKNLINRVLSMLLGLAVRKVRVLRLVAHN